MSSNKNNKNILYFLSIWYYPYISVTVLNIAAKFDLHFFLKKKGGQNSIHLKVSCSVCDFVKMNWNHLEFKAFNKLRMERNHAV